MCYNLESDWFLLLVNLQGIPTVKQVVYRKHISQLPAAHNNTYLLLRVEIIHIVYLVS